MNDIPPLPWLRAFEAASRNGNFSNDMFFRRRRKKTPEILSAAGENNMSSQISGAEGKNYVVEH